MGKAKGGTSGEYMMNKSVYQFVLIDMIALSVIYTLAILAHEFTHVAGFDIKQAFIILPIVIVFKIVVYYFMKFYQLILDNVGLDEIFRISVGVVGTNLVIAIVFLSIPNLQFINEMFLIFTTFVEIIVLAIPRMLKRILKYLAQFGKRRNGKRTLLVGAGAGGKLVIDEIRNNPQLNNYYILGFVDDDPSKVGKLMSGYKVFGPISTAPDLIEKLNIEEVIITIASLDSDRFQEIVKILNEKPVKIKRIPKFKDIKKDAPKKLLEVNVEDLLSRDVVELDDEGIQHFISGKKVLVTGAGGSIGSELVRQICSYNPKEVLMVDIYENGVYDLQMELNHRFMNDEDAPKRIVLIGSVYNYDRMKEIFSAFKPNLVFHAAAYKHVPLMEDSAVESVRTNILGTYNICKLSSEFGVEKMLLVSSDKAVRPTNVMGATKRLAEMIMQYFDSISDTNYSAVRFGNVLGSNGSVVPLFKRQIEHGGPLTVTDKNIIRYFMTIPEAVGLILQSSTYARGGEIFILDMGEPVKILDLAEKMVMLCGLRPYLDIQIEITGLRPGEKLYEELLVDQDNHHIKTENKKIFIEAKSETHELEQEIETVRKTFESLNNEDIKEMVRRLVPTYTIKK